MIDPSVSEIRLKLKQKEKKSVWCGKLLLQPEHARQHPMMLLLTPPGPNSILQSKAACYLHQGRPNTVELSEKAAETLKTMNCNMYSTNYSILTNICHFPLLFNMLLLDRNIPAD